MRWVSEYREARAADFGRRAVCLFCKIQREQSELRKCLDELKVSFKADLEGLGRSLTQKLDDLREEIVGGQVAHTTGAPPGNSQLRAIEDLNEALMKSVREEALTRDNALQNLRRQTEKAISKLREEMGQHRVATEPRVEVVSAKSPQGSRKSPKEPRKKKGDEAITDKENFIDEAVRRLSHVHQTGNMAMEVSPVGTIPKSKPVVAVEGEVPPPSNSESRKKRKGRVGGRRRGRQLRRWMLLAPLVTHRLLRLTSYLATHW